MTTRLARPRAGFTLIEVLIVMGIIAALAAISVGAFFQVRGSQDKSVTEVTLNKLHSTFDMKYKAVLDDARKSLPPGLVAECGNDKQRALVVWTQAKLKNEFPQTKSEVLLPAVPPAQPLPRVVVIPGAGPLAPRNLFVAVARNLPDDPTGNSEENSVLRATISSSLMYAALTGSGSGGTMGGSEGLQQQVKTDGALQYFRDSYDMPIGFKRDATNTEIQTDSSYMKTNRVIVNGTPVDVMTPFDPLGRMIDIPPTQPNLAFRSLFIDLPGPPITTGLTAEDFDNRNRTATFYSAGPNKEFGSDPVSLTVDEALDNLLSYRLRREGARGD